MTKREANIFGGEFSIGYTIMGMIKLLGVKAYKVTWETFLLKIPLDEILICVIMLYIVLPTQMYIRRDGSVQGPLWPREIRDIVSSKFFEVHLYTCNYSHH